MGGNLSKMLSGQNKGDINGFLFGFPFLTKEEMQNFKNPALKIGSSKAISVDGKKEFRSSIIAG